MDPVDGTGKGQGRSQRRGEQGCVVPAAGNNAMAVDESDLFVGEAQGDEHRVRVVVHVAVVALDVVELCAREPILQDRKVVSGAVVVEESGHRKSFAGDRLHQIAAESVARSVAKVLGFDIAARVFPPLGVVRIETKGLGIGQHIELHPRQRIFHITRQVQLHVHRTHRVALAENRDIHIGERAFLVDVALIGGPVDERPDLQAVHGTFGRTGMHGIVGIIGIALVVPRLGRDGRGRQIDADGESHRIGILFRRVGRQRFHTRCRGHHQQDGRQAS